ncbi:MAG: hypothetical protein IT270_03805 [Saprospiraceae bacterium]|nr:hypothetical protein [Saprospiraceae bacterium]
MKKVIYLSVFIVFVSCSSTDKNVNGIKSNVTNGDTSTYILNHFSIENAPSLSGNDTLIDLNFDGVDDFIIGYYGQAGTGIKNRVNVYLFDIDKNCYTLNEQLSDLPNPTFYIKKKKITGFYIGNGGGSGSRLEWINGRWTTTKEFVVENEGEKSLWQINYPLKNKSEKLVRPFQMIPPAEILETNISL